MSDESDKDRRIAELEQEVARLRAAQETGEAESAAAGDADADEVERQWMAAGEGAPGDEAADCRDLAAHMPSRRRAIVIAVAIGIVALVAIVSIFGALSGVIEPLSKSAAGALEPFEPTEEQPAPKAPPAEAAKDPMRAPGL